MKCKRSTESTTEKPMRIILCTPLVEGQWAQNESTPMATDPLYIYLHAPSEGLSWGLGEAPPGDARTHEADPTLVTERDATGRRTGGVYIYNEEDSEQLWKYASNYQQL